MKVSEMSESGDCLQDLSSGEFEGDEEYKTTYATLTPLRPLSPLSDSEKNPNRGGYGQNGLYSISDTSFSLKYNRDLDAGLKGYEFLEPLLPIAMLDGSGNMECCEVQPSLSLYRQASLLLPLSKDLDSSMSSEGLYSSTTVGGVSPFANGNQSGGTDSIQSSRSSTPDIAPHDSSAKRPLASVVPSVASAASDAFELNVDMEDVDTRDIAEKVSNELKKYNISQVLFAQTILGRSQGTLSDLLRNPKPWAKLKSGRETFCRMWKWLQVPEVERMAPFKGAGFKSESPKVEPIIVSVKPKPEATPKTTPDAKSKSCPGGSTSSKSIQFESDLKKRRMVFTDSQRASLRNIFRKTPRPSRELQLSIAHQLGLPVGTVSNFFMNARRRPRVKWQDDIHRAVMDDDSTTNSGSDAF